MSDTPDQYAKWLEEIAAFLGEREQAFECNCEPTIEYDVNAVIHQERCAVHMQDHVDIVLREAAVELRRLQGIIAAVKQGITTANAYPETVAWLAGVLP